MSDNAQGGQLDIGGMVLHHTADAYEIDFAPFGAIHWSPDLLPTIHLGSLAINLTPTKHVVFMVLAAVLVLAVMMIAGRSIEGARKAGRAPKGLGAAIEGLVLFVRNDIAIANIGESGAKFAPFIVALFFFVLFSNLLGLVPWGASPTGNLAVTGALAVLVFLTVEVGGFLKLGPSGYLHTIFPKVEGLSGPGAAVMSVAMAPIEILGKLVKPFALAVRLFGNMTAGHFVILSLFGIIFMFGHMPMVNWGVGGITWLLVTAIMFLELIVALLQAYVFALLSSVFIGLMQEEHH